MPGHALLLMGGIGDFAHYLTRLPFWEIDPEGWQQCVRVNLMGTFLLSHIVTPHMIAQGFGRIVNITTSLHTMQTRNYSQYGATKTALETVARILGAGPCRHGRHRQHAASGRKGEYPQRAGRRQGPQSGRRPRPAYRLARLPAFGRTVGRTLLR